MASIFSKMEKVEDIVQSISFFVALRCKLSFILTFARILAEARDKKNK